MSASPTTMWALRLATVDLSWIAGMTSEYAGGRTSPCQSCLSETAIVIVRFTDAQHQHVSSLCVCKPCHGLVMFDLGPGSADVSSGIGHRLVRLAKRSLMKVTAEYLSLIRQKMPDFFRCTLCRALAPHITFCTEDINDFACAGDYCGSLFCDECLLAHVERFKAFARARWVASLSAIAAQVRLLGTSAVIPQAIPRDVANVIWRMMCRPVDLEEAVMNSPEILSLGGKYEDESEDDYDAVD